MVDGGPDEAGAELAREQRRRARLAAELRGEGVELLEDNDGRVLVDGEPCPSCGRCGFPCWWSPPGGSTNKGNHSSGRDRWILSHCSTLDVLDGSQQAAQALVAERDTDGRPIQRLVVANLQLEPLEQGAQQRFGRRSQPFGRDQGKQIQQVHRLRISIRPLGDHGPQLSQFGLLLAVQFSQPPSDLLKQGPAGVVALLQRAHQPRLAALEVGNGSLERLDPRLPCRDLPTGDVG